MEWILAPIFAILLAMVGFVFWLGRRLVGDQNRTSALVSQQNEMTHAMLTLAETRPGELVCELGCGDASRLIIAVHTFGARGRGVESAAIPYAAALANIRTEGLANRIELIRGNFDDITLSDANVIFYYPLRDLTSQVIGKVTAEARPGTRVVVARYPLRGLTPSKTINPLRYPIFLYRV